MSFIFNDLFTVGNRRVDPLMGELTQAPITAYLQVYSATICAIIFSLWI